MDSVLDTLYAARDYMGPDNYEYEDWAKCTCGHIYRASVPDASVRGRVSSAHSQAPLYQRVLGAIIEAHPAEVKALHEGHCLDSHDDHATIASVLTRYIAKTTVSYYAAALAMIEKTIEVEEAKNEAARLDVLAQMETAVNAVDTREPALV